MATVAVLEAVMTLSKSAYENGLKQAQQSAHSAAQGISTDADKSGKAWDAVGKSITTEMKIIAGGFAAGAAAAVAFGVASIGSAARVQEMDVALGQLAKSTGISKATMDAQVKTIREAGVQYSTAQDLVAQFARSNLDMARATDLARVAQNLAIFTQQDSSETLQELLHGIQTGNTQLNVFRQLNINAGQAISTFADSLGKSTADLTGAERQQALLNAVIEAGVPIQGAYEAAQESAGKQMRSFARYIEDIKISVGEALMPAFSDIIFTGADLLKTFGKLVAEGGALRPVVESVGRVVSEMVAPVMDIAKAFTGWLKSLDNAEMERFAGILEVIVKVVGALGIVIVSIVTAYKLYTTAIAIAKTATLLFNAVLATNSFVLIIGAIIGLIAVFVLLYKNVEPFRNFIDGLAAVFVAVGKAIWEFARNAVRWIGDLVNKIVGFFQWLWEMLVGGSIVPDIVNGIIGLFQGMVDFVVGLITGFAGTLQSIWDGISSVAIAAWTWIKNNIGTIVQVLIVLVTGPLGALAVWIFNNQETVKGIISAAWKWVTDTVTSLVSGMRDRVVGTFESLRDAASNIMSQLGEKVGGALNWVIDRINDFINLVRTGLGHFGVEIPVEWKIESINIPAMAHGGIADRPTLAGEAGRESVIPWAGVYRQRAEELWKITGRALGFFGAMGGPGGAQGNWYPGNFPLAQGPGGSFSHQNSNAWDYMMPNGTPILLGLPGVVMPGPGGGYGTSLGVNLDSGGSVILGHLGSIVKTGRVDVGETIGLSDNTGFSTGPHLHLEFRNSSLQPGPGSDSGSGSQSVDIGSMVRGWADDIIKKHGGEEPAWLTGILTGVIANNAGGLAEWIANSFKDKIIGAAKFLGELIGISGGTASPEQLHGWMKDIGFMPAGGYPWADKIVGRESGWKLDAVGPAWKNDGGSRGLWQIQPGAHPWADLGKLFDGLYNTSAAKRIYDSQGPNAWSTNYDRGGLWPTGTVGVNRSGATEAVLTGESFARLLRVLERLDTTDGHGLTVNNNYIGEGVTAQEVIADLMIALRMP